MSEFKLTVEEANILEKIAEATKMDSWFRIDENLHVHDAEEPDNPCFSDDAGGVRLLEDGLAYGLDEPQSGGLSPEEIRIAEACFKRARDAKGGREIVVKCDDDSITVQDPQGLTDVIDAVISLYRDSEVTFQEFLETGRLEIVGLTLCEQAMVFAELKQRIDGDSVTIEGHDGEYGIMDLVDYLTKGPAPAPRPGEKRYYSVPVVYEMYGSISVEASSAEEAYDQVKNHPEEFDLPDEGFYVDESLRVSDDDRENAVETIRMLTCDDEGYPVDSKADPDRHTGLTVKATVTFQRWEGDVARFNGEEEFDACDALDSLDDEMIALIKQGDPNAYDAVYYAAVRLGQIHSYGGPFEVDLDEDNLSDYLDARYPDTEKEGE